MPDQPLADQTITPVCTAGICLDILREYIDNERPSLRSFYDEDLLMQRALQAEKMVKTLTRRGCDHQTAEQLSLLVLFDLVILVDDSLSMGNAEGGTAVTALKAILKQIAKLYDLANPGGISSIRFLNQELGKRDINSRNVDNVLRNHNFSGIANIGTMLDIRILEHFIYNRPCRLRKPLIVMMIIYSEVEGESEETLESVISECASNCKASSTLGEGAVTFIILRVGNNKDTERFLTRLASRGVQNLYCFPPRVPLEGLDDTLKIWKTLKRLFVDALCDTGTKILIENNKLGQEEEEAIHADIAKKEGHDQPQDILGQQAIPSGFSIPYAGIPSLHSSELLQSQWGQEDEFLQPDKLKQSADRLQDISGPDNQNSFQDSVKAAVDLSKRFGRKLNKEEGKKRFGRKLDKEEKKRFSRKLNKKEEKERSGQSISGPYWQTSRKSPPPMPDRPRRSNSCSDLSEWASADEDVEERSPSPPAPTTSKQRGSNKNQNSKCDFYDPIIPKYKESEIEDEYKLEDEYKFRDWPFHSSLCNPVRYFPKLFDLTTQYAIQPQTSRIVFRVRGIPYGINLSSISFALLHSPPLPTIREFEDITVDINESTLVPDCYNTCTQMQMALIQFIPRPPDYLQRLQTNETYSLRLDGSREEITIDKDFFGHTQLYPTTGQIAADIVAVCGLNGHPYGSWAAKANHDGNKRMWLRHFLPNSLPQCRTMVYGYNSNLQHQSRHSIQDYVDTFLEELEKTRNTKEERERPIILIGHSFGGIVIAHSIANATKKQLRGGSLINNIKGIVFFGTPHRGLVVDDLLAMIGDQSSRVKMVQDLSPDSPVLYATLETFIKICKQKRWGVVSFREREQTRKLVQNKHGVWARTGDYYTAVESESLVLNLPSSIEETLPAEGDHSTMVKFEHEHHATFTSLIRKLGGLIFKEAGHSRRLRSISVSGSDSEVKRRIRKRIKIDS